MPGARPVLGTLSQLHIDVDQHPTASSPSSPVPGTPAHQQRQQPQPSPPTKQDWSREWDREWHRSRSSEAASAAGYDTEPETKAITDDEDEEELQRRKSVMLMRLAGGSNASLSSQTGVGSQGIAGYLNLSVTRHGDPAHTRTFALPPSILSTLSYAQLARMLQLDLRTENTRWAGALPPAATKQRRTSTESRGTRSPSLPRSSSSGSTQQQQQLQHERSTSTDSVSAALGSFIKTILLPGASAEEEQLRRKRRALQTEDRKFPYRVYAQYTPPAPSATRHKRDVSRESNATRSRPGTPRSATGNGIARFESGDELWLPIEPFSFNDSATRSGRRREDEDPSTASASKDQPPSHSLYAALLHTHLRSIIASGTFWHLDVRTWTERPPGVRNAADEIGTDDDEYDPAPQVGSIGLSHETVDNGELEDRPTTATTAAAKVGRSLSKRISMSLGSWWNNHAVMAGSGGPSAGRGGEAGGATVPRAERDRAEWAEQRRAVSEEGQRSALPPLPPPPRNRGSAPAAGRAREPGSATPPGGGGGVELKRKSSFLARLFGGTGRSSKRNVEAQQQRGPIPPSFQSRAGTNGGSPYADMLYRPQQAAAQIPFPPSAPARPSLGPGGKRSHPHANAVPERNPFEDDDDDVEFARAGRGEEDAVPIARVVSIPHTPPPRGASADAGAGAAKVSSGPAPTAGRGDDDDDDDGGKGLSRKERKELKKKQKKTMMAASSKSDDQENAGNGGLPRTGFGTGLREDAVARAKVERDNAKGGNGTTKPWANRLPFRRQQSTLSEVLDSNERAHLQEREWLPPMPMATSVDEATSSTPVHTRLRSSSAATTAGGVTAADPPPKQRLVERLDLDEDETAALRRSRPLPPVDWDKLSQEAGGGTPKSSLGPSSAAVRENARAEPDDDPFADPDPSRPSTTSMPAQERVAAAAATTKAGWTLDVNGVAVRTSGLI
ncbi:hypothetical protein V8E36_005603 [Tilletia maclaganii]